MSKRTEQFFNDRYAHLAELPESILLDLARNEACPLEYRLTAVEIMRSKEFQKVNHPDLAQLLAHIEEEEDQFGASKKAHFGASSSKTAKVESKTYPIAPVVVEKPEEKSAPSASVTTATMFARPEIDWDSPKTFTIQYSCGCTEPVSSPNADDNGQIAREADENGVWHYFRTCEKHEIPENGQ